MALKLERHEKSKTHENAALAAVRVIYNNYVGTLIDRNVMSQQTKEVETHKNILKRLIDSIIFIGTHKVFITEEKKKARIRYQTQHFIELILLFADCE